MSSSILSGILTFLVVVSVLIFDDYSEKAAEANYMEGQVLLSCLTHEGERTAEAKESLLIYMMDGMLTQGEQDKVIQEAGRLLTKRAAP
jgi:hypothetical protein